MQNNLSIYKSFLPGACLAIAVFAVSCSKHAQFISGNNCITRVVPRVTDYNVSGPALDSIFALFQSNNLSTANLQFQSWSPDTIISPAYSGVQEQVMAFQFFNGLPVFQEDDFFIFNAGKYQPGTVYGYYGPTPNADTTGRLLLPAIQNAFLAHVSESVMEGGPVNSKPFIPSESSFADSCLLATLGYIDAGIIPGSTTPMETALVKVWKITPLNGFYPLVFVRDDNGLAWGVVFAVP